MEKKENNYYLNIKMTKTRTHLNLTPYLEWVSVCVCVLYELRAKRAAWCDRGTEVLC